MNPFDPAKMAAAVNAVLNSPVGPQSGNGCFIVAYAPDGFHTAVAARLNDVWAIQGDFQFNPANHGLDYGLSIKAVW